MIIDIYNIIFIRFAVYFLSTAFISFAYTSIFFTSYLRLLHFTLPYLHTINVYIYVYTSIYGVLLLCMIMLPRSLCQFFAPLFFQIFLPSVFALSFGRLFLATACEFFVDFYARTYMCTYVCRCLSNRILWQMLLQIICNLLHSICIGAYLPTI